MRLVYSGKSQSEEEKVDSLSQHSIARGQSCIALMALSFLPDMISLYALHALWIRTISPIRSDLRNSPISPGHKP